MSNQSVHTVTTSADKAKIGLAVCAVLAGVVGFYVLAGQATLVRASALVVGLLLGIIAALLVIVIVLLVDKVEDDEHMIETHSDQIVSIG